MELQVLVVDDDNIFNLMANVLLRELGIASHPHCFTDAQDALAYIDQHNDAETTYLIFLDINMPTMSGWEMLARLEALPNHRNIHVVIVTSSIDSTDQKTATRFGQIIDYMIKPLNRKKLAALKQHKKIKSFFPTGG